MKKNLLKFAILSLLMMFGITTVKAQSVTTYDFEDGNALFTADSRVSASVVEGDQTLYDDTFTLDGKAVKFTGASNAQNGYCFAHLDFSSLCAQAAKVKVEFETVLGNGARSIISVGDASVRGNTGNSSKNTYSNKGAIFRIGTDKNYSYVNGSNVGNSATVSQKWLKVTIEVDEAAKTYTYSVVNKATSDVLYSNGENPIAFYSSDATNCTQIDMFGYINNSQLGLIDNIVITVTKDERKQSEYTVNFLDKNSAAIKDAAKRSGAVGDSIALLPADKEPIWNADNTQKYFYESDNTKDVVIAEDSSTVVNIIYRDALVYNYTLVSNLGTTIASGSGFEGENIRVGYPRYHFADNKLYSAAVDNKEFRKTVTLNADNASSTVNYTESEGANAVFYTEAENINGVNVVTNDNIPVRASNAKAATATEDIEITTLPAGKYKFHVGIFTSKSSYSNVTMNFGIGNETFAAAFGAVNLNEVVSEEYTLTKATKIKYLGTTSWADGQFDYIWIEKTGDYVITPAYGTIWEDGETTTDTNENTIAEVDGAYFNNFAKANDTIRATVVVAAPARAAGPARIIATGNLSVFAGMSPIYEAANIPVGESKLDIALDNEDLAAIAEAGSLKFVYSNLTLKKVELLEGPEPEPFNPATAIVNNSFENCEAVAESIITTADAAGTDYAAAGWALTQNGPTWSNAAVFAYGSTAQLNGVAIPAIAPEGCGEKALGVTVGWGGAEVYQSAEAITLPAGTYTLAAYAYNANPDASQMTSKLGFIPTEGEAKVSTVVSYASEAWTVDYVTFTLDAATEGKFQIGGAAINGGSGANAKVFFDQLVLTDAEGLASLQSKAVAANEAIVQAKIAANTALVAGATEANPVAAPFVVNGTFDENTNGWTSTGEFLNKGTATNQAGAFTGKFWENWNGSAKANKMYQIAECIPNGIYKLNIAAFVNTLANPNESQYVYANNDKEFLTTGEPTMYEVYTKVENNTMEFGLEQTTATANWMGIDNISLTYYGTEANIDNIKFAVMLQEVAEALNAKQSVKTKTALETALTNFNAEKTDANIEALKAALAAAKVSINSYRILETGVLPDNSLEGWTCTTKRDGRDVRFQVNTWSSEGNSDGTNMKTPFIENWTPKELTPLPEGEIYYELPGLDPGIYSFTALIRAYSESGNAPTGASLFAMDREKEFATGKSFEYNNMKGIYDTYAMSGQVGEDGIFRFGIKVSTDANFNWMAFKNCRVAYVGAAITEESVNELAATMPEGKMNAEVKAAAEAAAATAKATPNLENYEALAKAIATAKASAAAYEKLKGVLDFIAEEVAKTNMYTAAAKATFDESIATAQKGYDEGTMSDADAAAFNYGSRLEGLLPTLLLSAYTSDVEGTPYINTWSVEGDNDGSEFKVPFYEYWTGDGNSLAANTITATLTGLEAGNYEVKAWVRVRMKNGAEAPAGITMSVNDETAVDVCAGDQIGTSPLYAKEFTAVGDVFAGDDLKFKFNIAADNTISWLSFKNVKYTRRSETVGITNVKSENKLDGTVYNLNGQKVEKAQRGLYIVNGKKVVVK